MSVVNEALSGKALPSTDLLTDEEIASILPLLDDIESWCKDVKAVALEKALNGTKFDGYKVVEGKSQRKWTDEYAVASELELQGYDESVIYEKKLKGLTAVESLMGKKQFEQVLGKFVEKSQGKPTLVPESDKRPAIDRNASAVKDFED